MANEHFSELTLTVTKNLSKEEKKNFGIFITPKSIIASLFSSIQTHLNGDISKIKRLLEPSCGTCEIINYCDKIMSGVEMDGVEYNTTVYDAIKDIKFKNAVKLVNKDFMKYKTDNLYDLINE